MRAKGPQDGAECCNLVKTAIANLTNEHGLQFDVLQLALAVQLQQL